MNLVEAPLRYIHNHFAQFTQELIEYARIPSISFAGFDPQPLRQAAEWTAAKMKDAGLEHVQLLQVGGAPPYVYGDWLHAPQAPTLFIYAHYDVQPPGRSEKWISPPFIPQLRQGRLYGRGVVDDKAGALLHLAALEAYLKVAQKLPLNVRVLIEGEEETGSSNLSLFLNNYKEQLMCDMMVLTDTANLEAGLPSLTYRLRGLVDATVEVRTLDHPVHSGMWGGPAVDALSALSTLLSRLVTPAGEIAIPDFYEGVLPVEDGEKRRLSLLPFDEERFRADLGAVDSLRWAGEQSFSLYERLWCRPSLAVLGIDAPEVAKTSNQIVEWARAKVSARIVSGMDPQKSLQRLCAFLAHDPPHGARVTVTPGHAGRPWKADPSGPVYEAAVRALKKGFGREAAFIGCGASIPFVEPLTQAFGGVPALLVGLEDPRCNAHGENESLLLEDWKKGMLSAVHLYAELAALFRRSPK